MARGPVRLRRDQVTASTTPFLTTEWDHGYRSQRIRDLLLSEERVSPDKMARVQLDTHHGLAPVLVDRLLEIDLDDDFTEDARDLLRDWDDSQPAGSSASRVRPSALSAAIFSALPAAVAAAPNRWIAANVSSSEAAVCASAGTAHGSRWGERP